MRKAWIKMHNVNAGILIEKDRNNYIFQYLKEYDGPPISLSMPVRTDPYAFDSFPPFFDGLLPEGVQLEGLIKTQKVDRHDYFTQLALTGADLVGAVTVTSYLEPSE